MTGTGDNSFNPRWETDIYAQGQHLNRYPYPVFIGRFLSRFGKVADRSAVNVLEVGSGAGNNLWFFAREGFKTHAIEGSASATDYSRARLAAEGLNADIQLGDFQNLPFEDGSMDFVLDRAAITHNTRPVVEGVLDEIRRVLKPGGLFFSQIFATSHSELKYARDYADYSAAEFSEGYFAAIGRTFFIDREGIDQFYATRFTVTSLELETLDNLSSGQKSAVWNIFLDR